MTSTWELRNRIVESAAKRLPLLEAIADDEDGIDWKAIGA